MNPQITLRALEKEDLAFIHRLNNNRSIMAYWFEEPYEAFVELEDLFNKHIHDQSERRFIAQLTGKTAIGLVELVEISYIHRRTEFSIIIAPEHQGKGYARTVIKLAIDYAFRILNLNKVYLIVSKANPKALHLYRDCGFIEEGLLVQEFFMDGQYQDVYRMYILQEDYLKSEPKTSQPINPSIG